MKNYIGNKAANLHLMLGDEKLEKYIPSFISLSNTYLGSMFSEKTEEICKDEFRSIYKYIRGIFKKTKYSIRSSPVVSMPGQLDTILNCGAKETDEENLQELVENVKTIFNSINNKRAKQYCKLKGIELVYPGIVIQEMVQGDLNDESGTCVIFTHNTNGKFEINGNYLPKALGEDIVSNKVNSYDITEMPNKKLYNEIIDVCTYLFDKFKFPQEVELTYEDGKLFILQTRNINFHGMSYINLMSKLYSTKMITEEEYTEKVENYISNNDINICIPKKGTEPIAKGIVASNGLYKGLISDVLITNKLTNDFLLNLNNYKAVITKEGSIGAHASTICRNLNIPYLIVQDESITNIDKQKEVVIDADKGEIYYADDVKFKKLTISNYLKKKK